MELPSAFPSLADSDSDSEDVTPFLLTSEDTALQTWQQLDSQLPQAPSAEPELIVYGRGVALQPGSPQPAGSPSTVTTPGNPTELHEDAHDSFQIAAGHLHNQLPLPFDSSAAADTDTPQLLGLDSLAGLDLGGLLQRLASRSRDSGSGEAPLRGLELPHVDDLFADLHQQPAAEPSGFVSAESLSEPKGSQPSTGGTNTPAANDVAAPFLRKGRKTPTISSEPDLPTVFIDVRPGRPSAEEPETQSEADSELLSSASEGELASMSAEVDSWRSARNSMKQNSK